MNRALSWKLIDNLKRKAFLKTEIKKITLKGISYNTLLPISYRYLSLYHYSKISKTLSIIQHKKKCVKTGRVWSTEKYTKYSRFVFRRESYQGNTPGFRRASW
jgi:ribosomal protein S14